MNRTYLHFTTPYFFFFRERGTGIIQHVLSEQQRQQVSNTIGKTISSCVKKFLVPVQCPCHNGDSFHGNLLRPSTIALLNSPWWRRKRHAHLWPISPQNLAKLSEVPGLSVLGCIHHLAAKVNNGLRVGYPDLPCTA